MSRETIGDEAPIAATDGRSARKLGWAECRRKTWLGAGEWVHLIGKGMQVVDAARRFLEVDQAAISKVWMFLLLGCGVN